MRKIIAAAILLLTPGVACADVGLPMLALAWPLQWLAFVPIVLLECELIRRRLKLPFTQMLWPTCKANLFSTIVGIPIAWIVMLPFGVAWVWGDNDWHTYFSFVILTIPFCLISIYLEEKVIRKSFPHLMRESVHPAMIRANVWSYAALSVLALVYPLTGYK